MKSIPRHFELWPAFLQKMWIKQNRPEDFKRIFGKENNAKTAKTVSHRRTPNRR